MEASNNLSSDWTQEVLDYEDDREQLDLCLSAEGKAEFPPPVVEPPSRDCDGVQELAFG